MGRIIEGNSSDNMIQDGWDEHTSDPNLKKELSEDQRKLFIQWLTDEKFYRSVLTETHRNIINYVMIKNKYDIHSKWKLAQIREQWITYLKKEPY